MPVLTIGNIIVIIHPYAKYFGISELIRCDMTSEGKSSLPDILSEKITEARKYFGLTLKQVSLTTGLSVSTLSDIENDKRRVSAVELYRFAQLYHKPISFFFEQERTTASFSILYRAAALEEPPVSRQTISTFHELCRSYKELTTAVGTPSMPSITDYSGAGLTTFNDAEQLAETERSQLGLNGQPIRDIGELLESKRGVKIFNMPEDPEIFSGAFAYDEELGPCFLINSLHPKLRRTFTIAHEYAHCLAHRNELAHIDRYKLLDIASPRERFANAFAAAFLMPRHSVQEILSQLISRYEKGITFDIVIRLAVYFGISFEATGWRLVSLRRLSRGDWEEIREEWKIKYPTVILLGYQNELDVPETMPQHYRFLANKAYGKKLISFERLAELLGRNYFELREEFSKAKEEENG